MKFNTKINHRAVFFGWVLAFAALISFGCAVEPQQYVKTSNPDKNLKLQLLFEHDGCKVYRFYDFGDAIYYADCRGGQTTSMSWNTMEGKVEVPHTVSTVTGK